MPHWFNLANLFTLLRLILVPYVVGAILDGRPLATLAVGELSNFSLIEVSPSDQLGDAIAARTPSITTSGASWGPTSAVA